MRKQEIITQTMNVSEARKQWGKLVNTVATIRHTATMTPITRRAQGIATHPEDDLVVAAAISAGVDYLVILYQETCNSNGWASTRVSSS